MIEIIEIGIHVWSKGHSVDTRHLKSALAKDSGRGWHMKCSCGKEWAR